jgi:hypothetical protein
MAHTHFSSQVRLVRGPARRSLMLTLQTHRQPMGIAGTGVNMCRIATDRRDCRPYEGDLDQDDLLALTSTPYLRRGHIFLGANRDWQTPRHQTHRSSINGPRVAMARRLRFQPRNECLPVRDAKKELASSHPTRWHCLRYATPRLVNDSWAPRTMTFTARIWSPGRIENRFRA